MSSRHWSNGQGPRTTTCGCSWRARGQCGLTLGGHPGRGQSMGHDDEGQEGQSPRSLQDDQAMRRVLDYNGRKGEDMGGATHLRPSPYTRATSGQHRQSTKWKWK